jgi:hypothetical protein
MRLNTDAPAPAAPRKPCFRDLATLVRDFLPPALVQLAPLQELQRRLRELNTTHPQFQEETPLVWAYETERRQRLSGELHLVGRPAAESYAHAAHPASRA